MMKSKTLSPGFTLLEVLIAITLTALVLGNLFALQSQSKRLAMKANDALYKSINQRAYLNAAWIDSRQGSIYMDDLLKDENYSIENIKTLKKPESQTKPVDFYLESYDVADRHGNVFIRSVRFKNSDVTK